MNGVIGSTLVVLVLAASVGGAPLAVAFGASDAPGPSAPGATDAAATTTAGAGNGSVPPGARFAGVVGTNGAELRGEVTARAFNRSIEAADSPGARANAIVRQYESADQRLDALEAEMARLREAHRNGTMSDGEYRARVAVLAARTNQIRHVAAISERHARDLPDETLRERGVNVSAIRRLHEHAEDLTGPEVATIARSVTGDRPHGQDGAPGKTDRENRTRTTGPPGDGGPGSHGAGTADTTRPGGRGTGAENGNDARGTTTTSNPQSTGDARADDALVGLW